MRLLCLLSIIYFVYKAVHTKVANKTAWSRNSLSEMNISSFYINDSASIFSCFLSFLTFLIRAHFLLVDLPCVTEQLIPHGKNIWFLLFYLSCKVYKTELWKCSLDKECLFTLPITLILHKCIFLSKWFSRGRVLFAE